MSEDTNRPTFEATCCLCGRDNYNGRRMLINARAAVCFECVNSCAEDVRRLEGNMPRGYQPKDGPANPEKTKPPDSGSGVKSPSYPRNWAEAELFATGMSQEQAKHAIKIAVRLEAAGVGFVRALRALEEIAVRSNEFEATLRRMKEIANMTADELRELARQAR